MFTPKKEIKMVCV